MLPCEVVVNIETRFISDPNVNIDVLDIPVNAVATALKDFFSKRLPPLFEADLMTELEDIAGKWLYNLMGRTLPYMFWLPLPLGSRGMSSAKLSMEVKTDRSCRLIALRSLLNKLPPINFSILKFIFQHFVR